MLYDYSLTLCRSYLYKDLFISSMGLFGILGSIGSVAVMYRSAMFAEIVSHTILPGILFGLYLYNLLAQNSNVLSVTALICIMSCAIFSCYIFEQIYRVLLNTSLYTKHMLSAASISLSFGISMFVISIIQTKAPVFHRIALSYMYGHIASACSIETWLYTSVLALSLLTIYFLKNLIAARCCDPLFFRVSLYNKKWLDNVIVCIIIFLVCMGIRGIGIMLTGGAMVLPVLSVMLLNVRSFYSLVLSSALVSILSAYIGIYTSIWASYKYNIRIPHGSCIIMVLSFVVLCSFLCFNKQFGIKPKLINPTVQAFKNTKENLLKIIWYYKDQGVSDTQLLQHINCNYLGFKICTFMLYWYDKCIYKNNGYWYLTVSGHTLATEIVRKHRILEVFLVQHMDLHKNNIHDVAESLEHKLSNTDMNILDQALLFPAKDPHDKPIPR